MMRFRCTLPAVWFLCCSPGLFAQAKFAGPVGKFPFDAAEAKKLQEAWSGALKTPATRTNSVGMKLALLPGGRFDMGPNGSRYRVSLTEAFYIGTTEVTLGQYRLWKKSHQIEGAEAEFNAEDRPAAMVSLSDARAYCEWLSNQPAEKAEGWRYALPTEAQWEWAARAGSATTRYFGDTDKDQSKHSWFNVTYTPNPKQESNGRGRQPVAKLSANAWGLYDMLGNVWEWCDDPRTHQATGETRDPVMRGGSWRSGAFHCTAVAHDPGSVNQKGDNIGFRVICLATRAK